MKSLLLSAALAFVIAGCSNNKSDANHPDMNGKSMDMSSPTTQASAQPINKNCAVEKDHPVDPTVTYLYQGKTIGFCCEDCIPTFKKDPEKYMKDLK